MTSLLHSRTENQSAAEPDHPSTRNAHTHAITKLLDRISSVYVHVTVHRHGNKRRSGWELLISRTRLDFQPYMPTVSFMLDLLLKATHVKSISQ